MLFQVAPSKEQGEKDDESGEGDIREGSENLRVSSDDFGCVFDTV